MGNKLAQQHVGLFNAHWGNTFLTNKETGAETQQVAMFAKGSGASGVDDFAKIGSYCNMI